MTTAPPTRSGAAARIRSGYAARDPHEHLGARIASSFRFDAESERLLGLRETRPEAYAALPNGSRTGLALYAGAKAAAAALGQDVSAPVDPA